MKTKQNMKQKRPGNVPGLFWCPLYLTRTLYMIMQEAEKKGGRCPLKSPTFLGGGSQWHCLPDESGRNVTGHGSGVFDIVVVSGKDSNDDLILRPRGPVIIHRRAVGILTRDRHAFILFC